VATEIDPHLLVPDPQWFPVQDVQIEEDDSNCGADCTVLEFAVKLQIKDGKLKLGEETDF